LCPLQIAIAPLSLFFGRKITAASTSSIDVYNLLLKKLGKPSNSNYTERKEKLSWGLQPCDITFISYNYSYGTKKK
jgi:hypothetical protein